MGTVHIQHIVQCGGGHPHGEILLPGLLVQVREVGVGLAFIGKGIEVCVGIILGQQEISQLVALLVHRPQGVVGAVVIGQRATGNDEVLVFMLSVIRNRFNIYMRIVLDTDIDIITIGMDTTITIFTVCGYNAVVSNQRGTMIHYNARRSAWLAFLNTDVHCTIIVDQNRMSRCSLVRIICYTCPYAIMITGRQVIQTV